MKKKSSVSVFALILILIFGSICCLAAEDDSQARIITIKTEIAETVISGTPIVSVLEGSQGRIAIKTAAPADSKPKAKSNEETSLTWLPIVTQDGSISLSGTYSYIKQGYEPQNVKLSATVKPGTPQKLPVIVVPAQDGKGKLEITLTVTAAVQTIQDNQPNAPVK